MAPSGLIKQQLAVTKTRAPIYKVAVLSRLQGHPFLHEKRRNLVPAFTRELQKLVPETLPEL